MSRRYFGTDGIRGRVGDAPITPEFVLMLGWACGRIFRQSAVGAAETAPVIIARDTRISGCLFEAALQAGLVAAGVNVCLAGPLPTPACAMLTVTERALGGIVISASHNPYHDNGIKFFNADGCKLPETTELAIEALLEQPLVTVDSAELGKVWRLDDAAARYIAFCKSTLPAKFSLRGERIVIDCAHGAAYQAAPSVLRELGAELIVIGAEPDGFNINRGAGSTDLASLQQRVLAEAADLGIALDGDGDRAILVDHLGEPVDGDELTFIIACDQQANGVVGTLMSNLGMELGLRQRGIEFCRAQVGDRHVHEEMRKRSWRVGGESSGHIICSEFSTTGDGLVAALQVLRAMHNRGEKLATLKSDMRKFPQTLINVKTGQNNILRGNRQLAAAVAKVEKTLGERGRVLLRSSGTEPVIRVLVEGEQPDQVRQLCGELAQRVEALL
ncbi:MAG: phosphoglucosamine mutase [Halieaceae bacterium]|nr:phosphoglucosamine mutase [Halieaceae bacterium]